MSAAAPRSSRTPGKDAPPAERKTTLLKRLGASLPVARRIGLWLVAAVLLTGGMRAVANHFLSGSKVAEADGEKSVAAANSNDELPKESVWWLPSAGPIDALDSTSSGSAGDISGTSAGAPIMAPIPNAEYPNSPLALDGGVQIGGNPWLAPKQLALLSPASAPLPATTSAATSSVASTFTAASPSLSENLAEAPASNFSSGGTGGVVVATAPEASASVLLAMSMAGLALARRRRR